MAPKTNTAARGLSLNLELPERLATLPELLRSRVADGAARRPWSHSCNQGHWGAGTYRL